jgi:hypothetical protein
MVLILGCDSGEDQPVRTKLASWVLQDDLLDSLSGIVEKMLAVQEMS